MINTFKYFNLLLTEIPYYMANPKLIWVYDILHSDRIILFVGPISIMALNIFQRILQEIIYHFRNTCFWSKRIRNKGICSFSHHSVFIKSASFRFRNPSSPPQCSIGLKCCSPSNSIINRLL